MFGIARVSIGRCLMLSPQPRNELHTQAQVQFLIQGLLIGAYLHVQQVSWYHMHIYCCGAFISPFDDYAAVDCRD